MQISTRSVVLLMTAVSVIPAAAQAASSTASGDSNGVEEIVVTAQKRAERLQDVPLSITALSDEDVKKAGIQNYLELTASVPGLKMTNLSGNTAPAIRGITQSTGGTPGADPNVATYVDGVYQAGSFALKLDLPDVSRIEVLKGPQGTLFGRNATGGAILIITKEPSFTPTGNLSFTYGNYNDQSAKGFISGPLVQGKLAGSISVFEQTSDLYFNSIAPGVETHGVETYFGRAKLLFTPTDNTRFVFTGYYGQHNDATAEYETPFDGLTAAQNYPGSIIPRKPFDVASNFDFFNDIKSYGASLNGTVESSLGTVTIIGSYAHSRGISLTSSLNAYIAPPYSGIYYYADYPETTWTAEVDLASKKYGRFSYIAGIYYYHDAASFSPLIVQQSLPGAFNSYADSIFTRQISTAVAIFGEGTFEITDKFSAIVGLRFSNEARQVDGGALLFFNPDQKFYDIPGPWYNYGKRQSGGLTERVSLLYKVTPNTNAYFTFSTGFRSGAFDATSVPTSFTGTLIPPSACASPAGCDLPYVRPERVTAYEIGLKTAPATWLTVDGAVFLYDYQNQQVSAYQNIGGVPLAVLQNAASSNIYGADLSVGLKLTPEFDVHAGLSLLHARFDKFPGAVANVPAPGNAGTVQVPRDVASHHLQYAPDMTFSLSATYTRELDIGAVSLTGNFYYTDDVFFDVANLYKQPSYSTIALQGSFSPARVPGLRLTVWGKNVTDETIVQGAFITSNSVGYSYDPPATFGFTAAYEF